MEEIEFLKLNSQISEISSSREIPPRIVQVHRRHKGIRHQQRYGGLPTPCQSKPINKSRLSTGTFDSNQLSFFVMTPKN